ncbi:MAG: hypothetical protein ACYDAB_08855 [bacterium]
MTFSIQKTLLDDLAAAVEQGAAPSKNALIERALRHELRFIQRRVLRARWTEAAKDPNFLRDIEETTESFAAADTEATELIQ